MSADRSHWVYAAVLLFIGAKMVVDPDSFIALGENVGTGIGNFGHGLRGGMWRDPWRQWRGQHHLDIPQFSRKGVRAVGVVLIGVGLLAASAS
jgi:hypothetical protein